MTTRPPLADRIAANDAYLGHALDGAEVAPDPTPAPRFAALVAVDPDADPLGAEHEDRRIRRTRALADAAEARGVRVLCHRRRELHVATDPKTPTTFYVVAPDGCACEDFARDGACGHHALLLSELGQIPDTVAERAAAIVADAWDEMTDRDPEIAALFAGPVAMPTPSGPLVERAAA